MITVTSFVRSFFPAFIILLVLLLPQLVGAQGLVPDCEGAECNFCHFMQLANGVINWLFIIVFSIFTVLIFIAGIKLVTSGGNQSQMENAKKSLTNGLIGILIMFSAWLIVDTMMKAIVNVGGKGQLGDIGMWNNIQCGGQIVPATTAGGGGPTYVVDEGCTPNYDGTQTCVTFPLTEIPGQECTPAPPPVASGFRCVEIRPLTPAGGAGPGDLGAYGTNRITDAEARRRLSEALGSGNVRGTPSGNMVDESMINQVIIMNEACGGCLIVNSISGGTHAPGSGHYQGTKIDFQNTAASEAFFTGPGWAQTAIRGGDYGGVNWRNDANNINCVQEPSRTGGQGHWDCCFNDTSNMCR